ncbi:MAG: hypothetical protein KatS3mg044_0928 [Rhodothermaceae bacterium]|nr:MAG: hypothetical protein KatS3mg044_0928 [Rhodothermaceae bacterium]
MEISDFAREAASGTSEWRLYVWKMALDNELPRYWLVGKGLAFHPNESLGFMLGDHYAWAVRTRNYHNGPLSLLIVLGLPGFVAFLGFLIIMIRRHLRIARGIWRSEKLAHFHAVMLVFFIVQVVYFIGIFGDVHISVPRLLFLGALLEGLVASDTAGSASSSVYQRSLGVG